MGGIGHLKFLFHSESSAVESQFLNEYGSVVRVKGPFLVRQNLFGTVVEADEQKGGSALDCRP
jgi:hypothetical protein